MTAHKIIREDVTHGQRVELKTLLFRGILELQMGFNKNFAGRTNVAVSTLTKAMANR